jgi:uncharacterized SAM-binding protein YcdF (DUF218 family)
VQDRAPQASIETLVVLTGFAEPDADMSLTGEVNRASAMRLLEAARLFARQHKASVIISGKEDVATVMKDVLVALKIPAQRIVIEGQSMNTYESAVNLRKQLGEKPFYLITSAGHMPRAMAVLTKQGLRPVPAPTDYLVAKGFRKVMPWISGGHLEASDLAVHEHIGRWWYSLMDRL